MLPKNILLLISTIQLYKTKNSHLVRDCKHVFIGRFFKNDINLLNECLLIYGTIDMNGYTINRQGNLYLTDGILNLNGGKLNIDGDFAIAGVEYITDSGIKTPTFYSTGAMLQMTNISDYIKIGGDFINFGSSTIQTEHP